MLLQPFPASTEESNYISSHDALTAFKQFYRSRRRSHAEKHGAV